MRAPMTFRSGLWQPSQLGELFLTHPSPTLGLFFHHKGADDRLVLWGSQQITVRCRAQCRLVRRNYVDGTHCRALKSAHGCPRVTPVPDVCLQEGPKPLAFRSWGQGIFGVDFHLVEASSLFLYLRFWRAARCLTSPGLGNVFAGNQRRAKSSRWRPSLASW